MCLRLLAFSLLAAGTLGVQQRSGVAVRALLHWRLQKPADHGQPGEAGPLTIKREVAEYAA